MKNRTQHIVRLLTQARFGVVLLAVFVIFTLPTWAQTQPAQLTQSSALYNLSITPPTAYLKLKPGSKANHTISLTNSGSRALTLTPKIVDFEADGRTGLPVLKESHTFPYFAMAADQLKPVVVEPGQNAQLVLAFEVPATAPDKEYPLTVVFESSPDGAGTGVGAALAGATASNLIVLVSSKDELENRLVIEDFGAPLLVDSFRNVNFRPLVKNERFSASVASGSAKLTSWIGKTLAEFPIYPEVVLGFSSRELRAQLDPRPGEGELPIPTEFAYDPVFLFGPVKISVTLTNPSGSDTFSATTFALPFSLFVAICIGIVIGIGYWYKTKRDSRLTF